MDAMASEVKTEVLVLPQFGSSEIRICPWMREERLPALPSIPVRRSFYRAILEGMAFQMYLAYERMKELGTDMRRMVATGGGASVGADPSDPGRCVRNAGLCPGERRIRNAGLYADGGDSGGRLRLRGGRIARAVKSQKGLSTG